MMEHFLSVNAAPPARAPSMLLPSGVQTEKVLMKGEELQLECITAGLYVYLYIIIFIVFYVFLCITVPLCSPTPDVTWMKMGEELSDRTKLRNFDKLLTISAVEETDQGKYMCTASNSAGKTVHYFRVIVEGRSASGADDAFSFKDPEMETNVFLCVFQSHRYGWVILLRARLLPSGLMFILSAQLEEHLYQI